MSGVGFRTGYGVAPGLRLVVGLGLMLGSLLRLGRDVWLGADVGDELGCSDRDGDGEPKPLKKNGTLTQEFTVTPHGKLPKQIAFLASATENDGLGPHGAGAMDIVSFDVTDTTPSVAAK